MMRIAPPHSPPHVTLAGDDGLHHLRLRLWQVLMTLVTLLLTAWCCTLGWIPAILAVMIAKHVLVAILVMGLGVDKRRQPEALPGADASRLGI